MRTALKNINLLRSNSQKTTQLSKGIFDSLTLRLHAALNEKYGAPLKLDNVSVSNTFHSKIPFLQ